MIRPPFRGRRAPRNRTRCHTFPGPRQGVIARLLVTSVLVAGAGSWVTAAQADNLPPILHETLGCNAPLLAAASPPVRPTPAPDQPQRLAIPSYFRPDTADDDHPYWGQMEEGTPIVGLAIINPASGPGFSPDALYQAQVVSSQAAGLIVLGYVDTDYGSNPIWDVMCQIDQYYDRYRVDGIFFDQASTDADGDDSMVSYYQEIHDYVKKMPGQGVVVINPGTRTDPAYLDTADIIVNFEGYYSTYASDDTWDDAVPDWERGYPAHRFWHLVHATSKANMPHAIALAKDRHAGWVYATPDFMDDDPETPEVVDVCDIPATPAKEKCNPWDTLPPDSTPGSYWSDMLQLVAAQP